MKRVATSIRCVPRFGYEGTQMRMLELDLPAELDDETLQRSLDHYFAHLGIADAVYDITVDDDGYFAVLNDEAFDDDWGTPIF